MYLTILTPTYNRYKTLIRLYESLKKQDSYEFEWILVDDGSTDETSYFFKNLKIEEFNYIYLYKNNGGKHTALNYSHNYINGKFVCIVDSDDCLEPFAVKIINAYIKKYINNLEIGCLTFLKGDMTGKPIEKILFEKEIISNNIDYRYNAGRYRDCCEVVRKELLIKYRFPEFDNEKFMGEGFLWVNIGFDYFTVFINKVVYLVEYLETGLSNSGRSIRIKSPYGGIENSNAFLRKNKYRKIKFVIILKETLLLVCYGLFAKLSFFKIVKKSNRPIITIVSYIPGVALYLFWKIKYRNER